MGVSGYWWFFKVTENDFSIIQPEFEQAIANCPTLPQIPIVLPHQPKVSPVTQEYAEFVLKWFLFSQDLSASIYYQPFEKLAFKILQEEIAFPVQNCIDMISQSRVLPPAILLVGIGLNRFLQLPGYLGNMLLSPDEVESVSKIILEILDVEWENYFARAKLMLDYGGSNAHITKDVLAVFEVLPNTLAKVKIERTGLLALVSWGCP